ncbi:MAG: NapC/NirT family cytochrome c [Betaproteobacteria bacterium]|nr:NapC/NirT family cytochrome c [Betaproteobacteria bacterium]
MSDANHKAAPATGAAEEGKGALGRAWAALRRPSARYSLLGIVAAGFVAGIVFWGGFNTAMEATNALEFCISCHEMQDTVYEEYKKTIHYSNRTGVRAICSDCHVPRDWLHKMARKIQASGEIYGKVMGTIDTPEKFEAKRLTLAEHEWARMKASDSRECRNCHSFEGMSKDAQTDTAWRRHKGALKKGETCIDCHKGIAHKEPGGAKKDTEEQG